MTTTVTMLQTRQGEGGSLWTVGNSYAASDAFATVLINSNYATGTLPKSRGLVPVNAQTDSNGQITALVDAAGNSFVLPNVISRNYAGITHTGTTANTKIFSFSIPANSIAAPSLLKFAMSIRYATTATAGSRVIRGYLNTADAIGGSSMFSNVMSTTGVIQTSVRNNDAILFQSSAIQRGMPVAAGWNSMQGDDSAYTTYDITTQDLFFVLAAQLADAGDSVAIRAFDATLTPG